MARRLKRPDGAVIEEYVATSWYFVEDGQITDQDHDWSDGEYTGRFRFKFRATGRKTQWYTERTAPKWLLTLYQEAKAKQDR